MNKIIMDPLSIRIPENTLVLMCGVQNSGKTTFVKKNFPKEEILCSDDILFDIARKNSEYNYYEAFSYVQKHIIESIVSMGNSGKNVIFDSIGFKNEERCNIISLFGTCFSGIIQIVIHPELNTILCRPEKPMTKYHYQLLLRHPRPEEVKTFWNIIQSNIDDNSICEGTDVTYILTDTNNISVLL